jgi:hypothetical protein
MKDLLIQTAERTGLVDVEQLKKFFETNDGSDRLDEALLRCPYFTEDTVLKLFAAALGQEFVAEISAKDVPAEFIEAVPATYAQHHYLIGTKSESDDEGQAGVIDPDRYHRGHRRGLRAEKHRHRGSSRRARRTAESGQAR